MSKQTATAAAALYLQMKGVEARDVLTHEGDTEVLAALIETETRSIVVNKAKARMRALKLKPEPEPVTAQLVLDEEGVPVGVANTTAPPVGPPDLVVLAGGGSGTSAVNRGPKPTLVPDPEAKPPSKVRRFTEQELAEASARWGEVRKCTKCKGLFPIQLRRMVGGKIRPQCGGCRSERPTPAEVAQ